MWCAQKRFETRKFWKYLFVKVLKALKSDPKTGWHGPGTCVPCDPRCVEYDNWDAVVPNDNRFLFVLKYRDYCCCFTERPKNRKPQLTLITKKRNIFLNNKQFGAEW